MNLAESPSPAPSSSSGSDDFAALLDSELELASAADSASPGDPFASPTSDDEDEEELEEEEDVEVETLEQNGFCTMNLTAATASKCSTKRCRVEEQHQDLATSVRPDKDTTGSSKNVEVCPHPGYFGGLCFRCGKPQAEEDVSGVAFGYIHKGLRLGTSEIDRLRGADLKNLLHERKLVLILDLDHTLINSTKLHDISPAENELGIQTIASKDDPNRSIFTLESMQMLTKLRPFVNKFLKEASNMFEMYIYTMGDKAYAIEIAKLLDPGNVYFSSKVISNSDCTQRHQKGLDVVLGAESVAVILDDTEYVWQKHKENLILMERYHYFASSCRQFGFGFRSLSESMQDERESDGALATILDVLKRIHTIFFDSAVETNVSSRDVRQVIKTVRKEVLQGCKLVFSRIFPNNTRPQNQMIWKMAEQMGAVCCVDVDSTVTHVVAVDPGTEKARWAVDNKKFLVHLRWIEAANFRWCRQPEEDFPVSPPKEKSKDHQKETSKDKENAVAGQKKDKGKENAVATTTGPTDS
ncbi:RNA polymerase II C-terminal domain phosphatase-like 4 isoform X2 [Phragmites australis]|uniref:RNA polymerase II C-terminal domain phosphatase-like 4 isoform X2 n=1 Tax=Phragmites australis TaxID=29695 RepID=UPI002D782F7D|nr:RNA polymerase II C-terminal domain phosphatase-like 4 isoform X2 [Phragmites australis]